ncbi:MAG: sugar phosphate isomerase/epimerase [Phycisphaerae bacterium]|nr:sugar phosphate isomerase/epimerase [Phycisphaerae bacterium]
MKLRHSVMLGLMGRQADRFHQYQPARSFEECLEMASRVKGADGVEVVYPQDFGDDVADRVEQIKGSPLAVSAVNLNVKGEDKYGAGSFTSPNPQVRAAAVEAMKTAQDLAAELGAGMITCCPLIDGHNYNFQVDYLQQWKWLEESLAQAAGHRNDIRISLEYKLNESRNFCILPDVGRTLLLCERLGLGHLGVTMDVGHALIAKETPAEALCLAAGIDRLFYVHFNDNAREWDWDMLPGSVNLWDLVELMYYLDKLNYDGWAAYDVNTRNGDPVETMSASIDIVNTAAGLLEKIGRDTIASFIAEGIPAKAFGHLVRSLL